LPCLSTPLALARPAHACAEGNTQTRLEATPATPALAYSLPAATGEAPTPLAPTPAASPFPSPFATPLPSHPPSMGLGGIGGEASGSSTGSAHIAAAAACPHGGGAAGAPPAEPPTPHPSMCAPRSHSGGSAGPASSLAGPLQLALGAIAEAEALESLLLGQDGALGGGGAAEGGLISSMTSSPSSIRSFSFITPAGGPAPGTASGPFGASTDPSAEPHHGFEGPAAGADGTAGAGLGPLPPLVTGLEGAGSGQPFEFSPTDALRGLALPWCGALSLQQAQREQEQQQQAQQQGQQQGQQWQQAQQQGQQQQQQGDDELPGGELPVPSLPPAARAEEDCAVAGADVAELLGEELNLVRPPGPLLERHAPAGDE
jgi:hypothetical protein